MKRRTLKICFSVCLVFFLILILFISLCLQNKNSKIKKELLSYANSAVNENIVNLENSNMISNTENEKYTNINTNNEENVFSERKIKENNNVLGKIVINKIDVNAPVMDGVDQDILKVSVGHFKETDYWNGNVALASHNRGSYAHYFEKINQLNIGDEIKYQTELGTRIYIVNKIDEVSEQDLSVLQGSKDNMLTLITCIKNKPELRLCIKAIEKI